MREQPCDVDDGQRREGRRRRRDVDRHRHGDDDDDRRHDEHRDHDRFGACGSGGASLFGPGCGATGQPCCNAEACENGGCWQVETVCVANGAACTAQNGYAIGTCAAGACSPCGGLGQPCCFEDQTANCVGGIGPGTPPCQGCTAPGTVCSEDDPQKTMPGTCLACGAEGQACCAGSECLGFYSLCTQPMLNTNVCSSACGSPGQPCCTNHVCRDEGCCLQAENGLDQCVSASTCATCGGDGGACCAGGLCDLSQFCNDAGTCETPVLMPP